MRIKIKPKTSRSFYMIRFYAFLSIFLFQYVYVKLQAQSRPSLEKGMNAEILFRIGKSNLDLDYKNNRAVINSFLNKLKPILSDSNYVVNELKIVGAASPDGMSEKVNIRLAQERAQSIKRYVTSHIKIDPSIIRIENKGENWAGLRRMVSCSEMPYREEVLKIIDNNSNRDERKKSLMFYRHSIPYLYMYKHFFPILRSGQGGASGEGSSGITLCGNSRNWSMLKEAVNTSEEDVRKDLLGILESTPNEGECLEKLKQHRASYEKIKSKLLSRMLYQADSLSIENWEVLKNRISKSQMLEKLDILSIIDSTSISCNRETSLKRYNNGNSYEYIRSHYFSDLLCDLLSPGYPSGINETIYKSLINENWYRLRYIIENSEIESKHSLLEIIDGNTDPCKRLESIKHLNESKTYKVLCDVYIPILLYGLSSVSLQNWNQIKDRVSVSQSGDARQLLVIINDVPVSMGRKEKLNGVNGGKTINQIEDDMLDDFLLGTSHSKDGGTGLSLSYRLTPSAIKRMEELDQLTELKNDATARTLYASGAYRSQSSDFIMGKTPFLPIESHLGMWTIGTNLAYLGALMPNIEIQGLLSRRISLSVEGMCAWWSQRDKHRYYQLAGINPELRYWTGHEALRGQYFGLMLMGGLYDLEDKKQGYQGEYLAGGLTLGYVLKLSRRLSLDFGLGGGYLFTQYRKYLPENDKYVYQYTDKSHYIGPLKLKLGLVWRPWKSMTKGKETSYEK